MSTREFFDSIGSPSRIVAPMVDHSGLAYRMLTRKYGAELVYTQMFSAHCFVESAEYRKSNFQTCPEDRPLVVQFCGNDPQMLLRAAKYVENDCDAVDINLGCPQGIARKGHYGAFLMEELELLASIVSTLSKGLRIPVTCKTRIYKDFDRSVRLLDTLVNAGASLITVHGRTREEKKQMIRACDWAMLKRIKAHFAERGVPVICNGGVATMNDFHRCLSVTGADGVMVSEAILEDPALFSRPVVSLEPLQPDSAVAHALGADPQVLPDDRLRGHWFGQPTQLELAAEYLSMCKLYPPRHSKTMRSHLMKMLFRYFTKHPEVRNHLGESNTLEEFEMACNTLAGLVGVNDASYAKHDWYHRHRDAIDAAVACADPSTACGAAINTSCFLFEQGGSQGGEGDGVFSGMGMFEEEEG